MIHYDIPEPELSPDFTLEDIHKIRAWSYERLKDATVEEQIADIHSRAAPLIEELKRGQKKSPQ
ncbi:MAG: hypothetical protein LBG73_07630 [Spirochaetaceae bacterium]|jgi:hypothetical protein|nr:hypothetical protein [Spirochaetaceae bacterium]